MPDFKTQYFKQLVGQGILSKNDDITSFNSYLSTEDGRKSLYSEMLKRGLGEYDGGFEAYNKELSKYYNPAPVEKSEKSPDLSIKQEGLWKSPQIIKWDKDIERRNSQWEGEMKGLSTFDGEYQRYAIALNEMKRIRKGIKQMQSDGGFPSDVYEGFTDAVGDRDFRTMGFSDAQAGYYLYDLSKKFDKDTGHLKQGEVLTPGESAIMESFQNSQWLDENSDYDIGYSIGSGAAQSIPFMAQFAATGGVGAIAGKGAVKILSKAAKKLVGKELKNKALKKGVKLAAGAVAQSAIMPSTHENIGRNRAGLLEEKDDGSVGFNPETQMGMGESIWRGGTQGAAEVFTERLGGEFLGRAIKSGVTKMLGDTGVSTLSKMKPVQIIKKFATGFGDSKFSKVTGFDGYLPEVAEEYIVAPLQDLLNWEYNETRNLVEGGGRPHLEIFGTTALVTGIMGGGHGIASQPKRIAYKRKLNKEYKKRLSELSEFVQGDELNTLNKAIESRSPEEIAKVFNPLLYGVNEFSQEQKDSIKAYMSVKLQKEGIASSLQEHVTNLFNEQTRLANELTNKNGQFIKAKNFNNEEIFIKPAADIRLKADGSVDYESSEKDVVVVDKSGSNEKMLALSSLSDIQIINAADFSQEVKENIESQVAAQDEAESAPEPLQQGERVTINLNGTKTQGEITGIDRMQNIASVLIGDAETGQTKEFPLDILESYEGENEEVGRRTLEENNNSSTQNNEFEVMLGKEPNKMIETAEGEYRLDTEYSTRKEAEKRMRELSEKYEDYEWIVESEKGEGEFAGSKHKVVAKKPVSVENVEKEEASESPIEQYERLSQVDSDLAREEMSFEAEKLKREAEQLRKNSEQLSLDERFLAKKQAKELEQRAQEYERLGNKGMDAVNSYKEKRTEALNTDDAALPLRSLIAKYFLSGGRINTNDVKTEMGFDGGSSEFRAVLRLVSNEAPTADGLEETLLQAYNEGQGEAIKTDTNRFRNELIDVLSSVGTGRVNEDLADMVLEGANTGVESAEEVYIRQQEDAHRIAKQGLINVGYSEAEAEILLKGKTSPEQEAPLEFTPVDEVVPFSKAVSSISSSKNQTVADKLQELSANNPKALPIVTVEKQSDLDTHEELSEGVRQSVQAESKQGNVINAFVANGKVFFVLENIESEQRALELWIHEQGIHAGLGAVFGENKDKILSLVADYIEKGLANTSVMDTLLENYPNATKEEIAEEYLAHLAEKLVKSEQFTEAEQSVWDKFKEILQQFIELMYHTNYTLSDKQVAMIVQSTVAEMNKQGEVIENKENNVKFAKKEKDGISESISQGEYGKNSEEVSRTEEAWEAELRGRITENQRNAQANSENVSRAEIEARTTEEYAKEKGLWIPYSDVMNMGAPYLGGNENDNYLNEVAHAVYKVNNLMNNKGLISETLRNTNNHNKIFKNAQLEFVGFTGFDGGSVYPIFKQQYVADAIEASPDEIAEYMQSLGFEKVNTTTFNNGTYTVSDLRPRNVLKDVDGDIYVIDSEAKDDGEVRFSKVPQAKDYEDAYEFAKAQLAYSRNAKNPEIAMAEAEVDTQPTEKQKEAGNYKKGHVKVQGLDISIEQPRGSVRSGVDKDGKEWSVTMNNTYGYFKGTKGRDGDHIDTFLGDNLESDKVFVIDQVDDKGKFDEHKVMLGFNTEQEAKEAYLSNYSEGWQGLGAVTEMSVDELKKWAKTDGKRVKPVSELVRFSKEFLTPLEPNGDELLEVAGLKLVDEIKTKHDIADYNARIEQLNSLYENNLLSYDNADNVGEDDIGEFYGDYRTFEEILEEKMDELDHLEKEDLEDGTESPIDFLDELMFFASNLTIEDLVKQEKGVTESIALAGYIMPDGELLDFSGGGGARYEDHRQMSFPVKGNPRGTELMERFKNTTGAVRIDGDRGSIDINKKPTANQMAIISQIIRRNMSDYNVDLSDGERRISIQNSPLEFTLDYIKQFYNDKSLGDSLGRDVIRFSKQSSLGFYSTVDNALEKIQQNKGTKDQFRAMLLKNGAKQAEMDWMGFDELPNKLTKQEVRKWIEANKIDVKEVEKEEVSKYVRSDIKDAKIDYMGSGYWIVSFNNRIEDVTFPLSRADDKNEAFDYALGQVNYDNKESLDSKPKYSDYQLPNGENYKELLLTMPILDKKKYNKAEQDRIRIFNKWEERGITVVEAREQYPEEVAELEEANELLQKASPSAFGGEGNVFKSSHFDEPNILAHIRFNERTDAEGDRVLFLEEIQSDWAQEGKKKGFDYKDKEARLKEIDKLQKEGVEKHGIDGWIKRDEYKTLTNEYVRIKNGVSIPDMPFKKTDQWVSLALRRMMRYATENGFAKIAWATGEQQAERYDLSNQLNEISTVKLNNGFYNVFAYDKNGRDISLGEMPENDLAENIGKDLAEKVIKDSKTEKRNTYTGLDLSVGGEGMKDFYNKIVPSAAKKVGKAFKSVPQIIEIDGIGKQLALPVTEEMQESVMEYGVPMFSKQAPVMPEKPKAEDYETAGSLAEAQGKWLAAMREWRKANDKYQAEKRTYKEKWMEAIFDKYRAVKKLQLDVEKAIGRKLSDSENAYVKELLRNSKGKQEMEDFQEHYMAPLSKAVKALQKKAKVKYKDVVMYMLAKHAVERNAYMAEHKDVENGSGIETKEAEQIVKEFEAKADKSSISELWNQVNKATRYALDKQYRSGLLSLDLYKHIKGMYKHYVPMRGWNEETSGDLFDYMNRPFPKSSLQKMKKAEGRSSLSDDPLPYIASMAESSILMGGKNEVRQALLKMVRNHPQPELYGLQKVWMVNKGTKETPEWVEELYKPSDEVIKSGMAYEKRNEIKGHKVTPMQAQAHQVEVWENGRKLVMDFVRPDIAAAVKGENIQRGGMLDKVVDRASGLTRMLSRNFTSRNPSFTMVNMVRDMSYAAVMNGVKHGSGKEFIGNVIKCGASLHKMIFNKNWDGKSNEIDGYLKEFLQMGGETGFLYLRDIEAHRKEIRRMLKNLRDPSLLNFMEQKGMSVLEFVEKGNRWAEDLSRFTTYYTLRKRGMTPQQAAYEAKEITVNFNRQGTISSFVGSLYAFFNAAMQGVYNFGDAAVKNKKAVGSVAFGMFALGAVAPILARFIGGADDEDNYYYDMLPDYERSNHFIFALGGNDFVKIPLPHILRAFYGWGESIDGYRAGKKDASETMRTMLGNFVDDLSPVSLSGGGLRAMMPTAVIPLYDNMVNENFAGYQVYKEPHRTQEGKRPQHDLASNYTNGLLVAISRLSNKFGGGSDNRSASVRIKNGETEYSWVGDKLDWNPSKVEHVIEHFGGGMLTFLNNTYKLGAHAVNKAQGNTSEYEAKNVPIARRFYRKAKSKSIASQYFDLKKENEDYEYFLKKDKADGNHVEYTEMLRNTPRYRQMQMLKIFDKQLKKYRKMEEMANGNKAVLQNIENAKEQLYKQAVKQIRELKQAE